MIWTDINEELLQCLIALNEFYSSLHFTYTYYQNSIDFLDLTIYKGPTFSYMHPYPGHKDIPETPEPLPIFTLYLKPHKTST